MPDCQYLHRQGTLQLCRHAKSHRHGGQALIPAMCGRCAIRDIPCEPLPIPLTPVVPFATPAPPHEPIPESGPGTELKKIFEQLGFGEFSGCGCTSLKTKMDRLGPDGCRERLDEIVAALAEKKKVVGFLKLAKAGAKAVSLGLPLTVRGLVLEACRLAEADEL